MDWYTSIFELIDMRSFSNLWFWIALAVTWSTASHWVLGVPFDMVQRARRHGAQPEADLVDIARVNVNRLLYIGRVSGLWILGVACFLLTTLATLGFWYEIEFAQALFAQQRGDVEPSPQPICDCLCCRCRPHRVRTE